MADTKRVLDGGSPYAPFKCVDLGDGSYALAISSVAGFPFIVTNDDKETSANFTRPSDTTAYAASDAVSNSTSAPVALTFANAGRTASGTGVIVKARIATNASTVLTRFKLWLYNVSPTPINDNAAFTLLDAQKAGRIGAILIGPTVTEGTGSDSSEAVVSDIQLPYTSDASGNLYGLLETPDGFTPTSGETFFIYLTVRRN